MSNKSTDNVDGNITPKNLRNKSVKSAAATTFAQFSRTAIQIGGTAILARLISPEDFGLIAMTTVITGFVLIVKDLGLSTATVQKPTITHEEISALFWINTAVGFIFFATTYLCAPLIAKFYSEQKLIAITQALSFTFALSGIAVQPRAILKRKLSFYSIATIEISALIVGTSCAIFMAMNNFSYWSLVGQLISVSITELILSFAFARWLPSLTFFNSEVKSMVKFGSDIAIFNIVNYFSRSADNLLIGWYWGAAPLAFYGKAYGLLIMPIRQINSPMMSVATPVLSKTQNDPKKFNSYFLKAFFLISFLSIPMIFLMFIFAEEIIHLLLGPNWARSATIFQILAPAALLGALTNPVGSLLVPLGKSSKYRTLGLINSTVTTISFCLGLRFGPEGVATSYSIACVWNFTFSWWYATRSSPVTLQHILTTLAPPLTSTILAGLCMLICMNAITDSTFHIGPAISFLVSITVFSAIYMLCMLFLFRKLDFFILLTNELLSKVKVDNIKA